MRLYYRVLGWISFRYMYHGHYSLHVAFLHITSGQCLVNQVTQLETVRVRLVLTWENVHGFCE